MSAYDDLQAFQVKPGKGYEKRSVEEFRAIALTAVDDLLRHQVQLKDQLAGAAQPPHPELAPGERRLLDQFRALSPIEQADLLRAGLAGIPAVAPARPAAAAMFPIGEPTPMAWSPGPTVDEPSDWLADLESPVGWGAGEVDASAVWTSSAALPVSPFPASAVAWDAPPTNTAPVASNGFSPSHDWFLDQERGANVPPAPKVDPEWFGTEVSAPVTADVVAFPARPAQAPRLDDAHLDSLFDQLDFGRPPADVLAATSMAAHDALPQVPMAVQTAPNTAVTLPAPVQPWSAL